MQSVAGFFLYLSHMRTLFLLTLLLSACQAGDTSSTRSTEPQEVDRASLPDTAMVQTVTVDQTASLVENLTVASPSVAIQTIDLWTTRLDTLALEGTLADTLSSLRSDLETLRGELQSSPLQGRVIGTTLRELGRKTTVLAQGDGGVLKLAEVLSVAGESLAPRPVPNDTSRVSTDEESSVQ